MSLDISTAFTKYSNMQTNRGGYILSRKEKKTDISPRAYGEFISRRKKKGKN